MSGEDKLNPNEKMNIQSEYYLETLITNAFKGKGFQKISELFEDKVVCSSQRHSKILLNQLDRLINKELDRNEFKHVSLLMKCIQHFCKSESQEGFSLIQQGLVAKMVLWFERTLEFLKICKDSSITISPLIEEFYDTAVVICKCNSEDGVKQLLDTFLFTLGYVILENWPPFQIRLEALKTFNFILDQISREEKKKLNSSEDVCTLMQNLARKLFEAGDYDIQVAITEALCRMTTKKIRDSFAQRWFEDSFFTEAFKEINDKDFETDCRKFLNTLNSKLKDTKRVYTFPCISVSTDIDELTKPQDDKLEHFWIDFNVGSQTVSFYVQNNEGCLWDSIRIQKESLTGYSLEVCDGHQLLGMHLKTPISISRKDVKYMKIKFELEPDIRYATVKTYGEDLQMNIKTEILNEKNAAPSTETSAVKFVNDKHQKIIQSSVDRDGDSSCSLSSLVIDQSSTQGHLSSPQQADTANNLQDALIDSHEGTSNKEKMSTSVISGTTRVLEFNEGNTFSEISRKNKVSTANETEAHSPKQQSAKKKTDVFAFRKSSECSDIEVSDVQEKVIIPMPSSSRKTDTPNRPVRRSSHKNEAEKADDKDNLSSGSDKSWFLERRKKSLAKSADYSRKRQKSKSRLKVLPLSSQSSDEVQKSKKRRPSNFTEIKKGAKEGKGVAESLSFSDLKLPGVSALLTPRDSIPQSSGTLHTSDLDQDTMDPLQEGSSPDVVKFTKPPQSDAASKKDLKSNEEQIELRKWLHHSGYAEDLKKKRKRSSDEVEVTFKPRKLFSSAKDASDLEDDVFKSESHESSELTECSFSSSFQSFTEGLKKKMMTRYKRMEIQTQNVLKRSHRHVSNLMSRIQQSNFQKLDHFHTIVAQELSSFETETRVLKELEKETLDFWEAQNLKINEFCTNQRQRIEDMDHKINESLSNLTKKEERTTDVKENLQKL